MAQPSDIPRIIDGAIAVDDRGALSFVNDFTFDNVKRFYVVENHEAGFIRAWHGHKHESKYIYVVSGSALVVAVSLADAKKDLDPSKAFRTVLSDKLPKIVEVPGGYYNAFKTLTPGTKVMFFSTSSLNDSKGDDVRLPYDAINPKLWEIPYR